MAIFTPSCLYFLTFLNRANEVKGDFIELCSSTSTGQGKSFSCSHCDDENTNKEGENSDRSKCLINWYNCPSVPALGFL